MQDINIEIKNIPKTDAIGVFGTGPFAVAFKKSCGELFKYIGEHNIQHGAFLGFFYDNPCVVPENELKSAAAVKLTTEQLVSLKLTGDEPIKHIIWEEGEYAMFIHKGPYEKLHQTYEYFFKTWLPKSNRVPSEKPSIEQYLNDCTKVAPEELITEIYIKLN
ncbi:hypothetical protein PPL_08992 [Heterostelium album PN500]|uniref:AraC effector-binding domain-containing protein n=1 Tax=Heterostelium pallidum (strain ATCC 26659 / Pp 5 / PN500) TaxID=670386 RepID=D3BKB1_HETP5|nr:hypothetical protein PPL_08992 [Heterostelium album PN500]EFA78341.1 hypothetical protein PPL_08992 [Heterostelium album PN500]|eukprot:XP_020430466.1 hypothetical protein PPL_08992 [Heterostelium album PN500]